MTPSVPVGAVIAGKYRVEKILGAGAMGVVVAARHLDLHELRAIKLMMPASAQNAEGVERFLREARAAARLRSEHVAKVHDVGRLEDGSPYAVIEYLEGSDLKAVLDGRGALPPGEAIAYLLQVCEAIGEAHAAGIVHRDLKPANLFLTRTPSGAPCVKVLDFGIAKMANDAGAPVEMTATSQMLGTPLYMSPEQMRGSRDVDGRADIWALGVILYRMLTGQMPFSGTSITEICSAVIADAPRPPRSHRPDLPESLERIILRCLEKSPTDRYSSVAELKADLAVALVAPQPGAYSAQGGTPHSHAAQPASASPVGAQAQAGAGYGPAAQPASYAASPAQAGATYGPGGATAGPAQASATYGPGGATAGPAQAGAAGYAYPAPAGAAGYAYPAPAGGTGQAGYGAAPMPSGAMGQAGYGAAPMPSGAMGQAGYGAAPVPAGYAPAQTGWAGGTAQAQPASQFSQAPAPRSKAGLFVGLGALGAVIIGAVLFFALQSTDAEPAPSKGPQGSMLSVTLPAGATGSAAPGAPSSQRTAGRAPGAVTSPTTPGATTTTPPAPASASASATQKPGGASPTSIAYLQALILLCWKGNEGANPGEPASSATVQVTVAGSRSVVVSGPAKAKKGFTACVVTKAAASNFEPGDTVVVASASLPPGP